MARRDIGGAIAMRNTGLNEEDADALFLTEAEADALFLTQAEGDTRYKDLEAVATPTYVNSWVADTSLVGGFGYYRDTSSRVFMRGGMKGGTNYTVALNLPVGFRPMQQERFFASTALVTDLGEIVVGSDGDVYGARASANTAISVLAAGHNFRTDA